MTDRNELIARVAAYMNEMDQRRSGVPRTFITWTTLATDAVNALADELGLGGGGATDESESDG